MKVLVLFPHRENSCSWRKNNNHYMWEHYRQLGVGHGISLSIHEADDDHELFNRGRALHNGFKSIGPLSRPDVMIFADGDLFVPLSRLLHALEIAKDLKGYVVPFTQVKYLPDYATEAVYTGARIEQGFRGIYSWTERSTGGINVLTPDVYEQSGGFDPRFVDWGFEDAAFDAQVQTLVGPCKWLEGPSYHLYHPSARRGASPEFATSRTLCDRYRGAMHNPEEMKAIIGERK